MSIAPDQYPSPFSSQDFACVPLKRAIAWIFDVVLIALLCTLILPFTAFTGVFFFPLMMLVVGFLYRWFTIAGGSATWGMRIMGIGLREINGAPLNSSLALAHTTGYTVSVAMAPLQLISCILMLFSARGQGLSDFVLGTTAVNLSR